MWKVQLFKLNYDDSETRAAAAVIDSGWLTMGERVVEFEGAFSEMLGGGSIVCTAVTNCTAALHMAVLAAGVKAGDEVIISAVTFVADANVVRMCSADPVLADCVSEDDLTIDPEDIERKITPRTRAVIVVHYAGYPCDMDRIMAICQPRGIKVIEDVAHAPGAAYKGRQLGTIGDIGCFSFFSNKNLSVGEGGMLSCRDQGTSRRLRFLRSHGMTTLTLDRHEGRAFTYDVVEPGLNYRMDEVHAALGLVQLRKLMKANLRRGEVTKLYREQLMGSAVSMPFSSPREGLAAFHILPTLLPPDWDRQAVMQKLKEDGIQSSIHYPPFWAFSEYRHFRPEETPKAAEVCRRQLTLPLYPTMTDDEVALVTAAVRRATGSTKSMSSFK